MKWQRFVLSALIASVLALGSSRAWGVTKISTCTRITHPGAYALAKNITATTVDLTSTWNPGFIACIVIDADFVTLDLGGYVITGPGGTCTMKHSCQRRVRV